VIVGCVPVVLAVAGPLLERRPVRPRVVAAALLVAAGAAAVQWAGGEVTPAGLAFSLGALACEAAFSLLAIPLLARLGPLAVSTYACLLAVPMLTLWSVVADGPVLPAPSLEEAAALAYIAVLVTVFGFVAWYSALSLLGVERAGLFSGAIPVSALLCSALVGAAELTPARLAAGAVVALGVTLGVRAGAPASPAAGAVPPLELARPAPGTAAG
jgi:drug/metabolite transporter (DMT)-like permease